MVLAGSVSLTALPLSASAAISGYISISDSGGGNVDPCDITHNLETNKYEFTSGSLERVSSKITANHLWAFYGDGTINGQPGAVLATFTGDKLAEGLYNLKGDGNTYNNPQIKSTHKYFVTTDDPAATNISAASLSTVSEFSSTVSEYSLEIELPNEFDTSPSDPLMTPAWTAWFGILSGNTIDANTAISDGTTNNIDAGSSTISVPIDTFISLYDLANENFFKDSIFERGATVIQLHTEYKTFEIPVYDGMGNPTDEWVKVTNTSNGALIPEGADDALKGKYVLLYDGEAYYDGYITTKSGLWNAIKAAANDAAANDKGEFNPANARLVRYVDYNVITSSPGSLYFSSIDLANNATKDGITYLNARKTDASIWEIRCWDYDSRSYTYKVLSGSSFDAELKDFLDNNDYSDVQLKNENTIYLTATNPSTKTDKKLADSEYTNFNSEDKYPVKVSDLAAKLTSYKDPDPGKKYDVENCELWTAWPPIIDSGFNEIKAINKTDVNIEDKITVEHYEGLNGDEVLIYFPQTDIKLAATVTGPDVGAVPADVSAVTVTGDGSASAVNWSVNGTALTDGETFTYEKPYTFEITLTPSDGLKLTADTTVTINGKDPASKKLSDDGTALIVSYTFEAIQRTAIPAVEFSLDQPKLGEAPDTTAAVDTNANFTVSDVKWEPADGTFKADTAYTAAATLTPSAGYKFTATTTAKVNGVAVTPVLNPDGTLTVSYTFPATDKNTVSAVELAVDAPVLGGAPDVTADIAAGANYTASAVTWTPADGTYKADTAYTAAATLTPSAGYKFTATTTAKVNGVAVTPVLNPDGTLTVSYTFAELKANPWLDIENKLDDILNGENPTITVPSDNPTIPKSVLDEILNGTKPVIIKFEPDNGISWEILPGGTAPDGGIDLSVIKDNSEWATVVNNITGETIKMQISISHTGPFGFTANLVVDLTQLMQSDKIDQNGTYYANLYLVPDKDNSGIKPEWKGSDVLEKDQYGNWIAKLKFTHASDWLITIDDKDKDPSKNNNNGGSGSSGGGSFRPSGSSTTTESSTPMFGGKAMSWSDIVAELKKLPIGSEVTIELNGITNVPFEVINVISERKLKTTFKFDSVRSWKLNGAEITAPAAADLSIIAINRLKTDSLRGISGYQFTINDTNIPTGIEIAFKTEYAGKFANLYKVVDGKLTFVTCAKVGTDGKVILSGVADKGEYAVMLGEFSDILGDVNNDGVLNALDASAILKDIVDLESVKNPLMGDFNGDGTMNAMDASAIMKISVGLA